MKNSIVLVFATLISLSVYSQSEYNYALFYDNDYYQSQNYPIKYKPIKKVKKITFDVKAAQKRNTLKHIKQYNEQGQLISYYYQEPNKEMVPLYISEYDGRKLIKLQSFSNGKLISTNECKWSKNGNIIDVVKKNKKQKVVLHSS